MSRQSQLARLSHEGDDAAARWRDVAAGLRVSPETRRYGTTVSIYLVNLLQDKSMNWVLVGIQLYAGYLGATNGSRSAQFC